MLIENLIKQRYFKHNGYTVESPRIKRMTSFGGIKEFEGNSVNSLDLFKPSVEMTDWLKKDARVWRTEETLEASKILANLGKLIVIGAPQSGKGTILYGISEICDLNYVGYTMIDLHHQETDPQEVAAAIAKTNSESKVLLVDSFDYLFLGSRKIRRLPGNKQEERAKVIIDALSKVKIPVVLTMHDSTWASIFLSQELVNKHSQFISNFPIYELPRDVQTHESRLMFLVDHGFTREDAELLASFQRNLATIDVVVKELGDKAVLTDLEIALKDYAVLKSLAREKSDDVIGLLNGVKLEDTPSILKLVSLIRDSLHEVNFLSRIRSFK